MTRKNKWASPLFILSLAVASVFGVGSAVINNKINNEKVVVKTEALGVTDYIYLRPGAWDVDGATERYAAYFFGGTGDAKWYNMSSVTTTGEETLYRVRQTGDHSSVILCRMNGASQTNDFNSGNCWNKSSDLELSSAGSNLFSGINSCNNNVGSWDAAASMCDYYFKTPVGGTVTINLEDGNGESKGSKTSNSHFYIYSDWKINLSATPSSNYSFTYWTESTSEDGDYTQRGSSVSTSDTVTGMSGEVFHSALFTGDSYTITYKDRGNVAYSGSNSASLVATHTYGTATDLVSGVKSGYLFKGWYDNSGCTGDAITSLSATGYTSDITLYAKFVKQPSTSPVFVLVGNSTFNQSMGGDASSPTWEYFTSAQEMRDTPGDNQQAAKNNVILSSGSYLKFTKYHDGDYDGIWTYTAIDMQGTWAGTYLEQSGSDIVVKTEGNGLYYSFYVGNDNTLHVYPSFHTVHMKGVFIRGNTTTVEASDLTPATPINGVALHAQTYTAPTSSWSYTYGGVSYTFDSWYTDEDLTTPYTSTNNVTSDITIYAKFQDLNNYLTYDHNDGSGTTQLADPSHIDTTPSVLGYQDLGWSDSFFRSFANWNTEANGSGTSYDPGDSISVSSATTLYAQQNWHQVYISVDNGSTWHATKTTFPSGMQIQYETTEKLIVDSDTARIKLKYHNVNTGADVILNNGDISFEGNNYNAETGGVNVSFTDCIFLKVKNDNTLQCYIPGASTRTLLIKHASGGETAVSLQYDNDTQWSSVGYVYMRAGDKIWARYMTESAYKSWYMSGDGFEGDSDGVATCVTTGAYKVYLQRGNPESWKDIVVSRNEPESAAYFARLFNSQMGAICAGYNTNTAASFIDAWQENASENAVTIFGELSTTCQNGLKSTTYDADSDVAAFKERYDYILSKYGYGSGDDELRDFLGRTPAFSAIRNFTIDNIFGSEDSASTIIIIIASSVALLSVTALSILVLKKKRREQE